MIIPVQMLMCGKEANNQNFDGKEDFKQREMKRGTSEE